MFFKKHLRALRDFFLVIFFLFTYSTVSIAADKFLRGGIVLHPSDIELAGRWQFTNGVDYPINFSETIHIGFETQTSVYRQDVVGTERTAFLASANGFINAKYKSRNIGLRPYAGVGVGLLNNFTFLSGNNDWSHSIGYHTLVGVELGRIGIELQLQNAFDSSVRTSYAIYAGFVW